jgi:hypothetical protein
MRLSQTIEVRLSEGFAAVWSMGILSRRQRRRRKNVKKQARVFCRRCAMRRRGGLTPPTGVKGASLWDNFSGPISRRDAEKE